MFVYPRPKLRKANLTCYMCSDCTMLFKIAATLEVRGMMSFLLTEVIMHVLLSDHEYSQLHSGGRERGLQL